MAVALLAAGASPAHALEMETCPMGRELAVKGIEMFDLQPGKGVRALREGHRYCPQDLAVTYNLALALFLTGEKKEARDLWQKVLEVQPDHLKAMANLAWTSFELGDDETAHIKSFVALGKHPGNQALAHTKVFSLFRLGRYMEAFDWLTRAGLEGVRARKWQEEAATYMVETLWRQFRDGDEETALRQAILLATDYPGERLLIQAKDQIARAKVDVDAEIPFEQPLPHLTWAKTGDVDHMGEVLDNYLNALPSLHPWERRSDAFAVIAGVYQYRQISGRQFANRDAANLHSLLLRRGQLRDDPDHVRLRLEKEVTHNTLKRDLEWLVQRARLNPNAMILFYFVGLGAPWSASGEGPGEDALLLPVESEIEEATPKNAISLNWLKKQFAGLPNREVVVLVDACFTGHSPCARGNGADAPPPDYFRGLKGWLFSSPTVPPPTYDPGRQNALGYFLIQGLLGEADGAAGRTADGWVDFSEAVAHLRRAWGEKEIEEELVVGGDVPVRLTRSGGNR